MEKGGAFTQAARADMTEYGVQLVEAIVDELQGIHSGTCELTEGEEAVDAELFPLLGMNLYMLSWVIAEQLDAKGIVLYDKADLPKHERGIITWMRQYLEDGGMYVGEAKEMGVMIPDGTPIVRVGSWAVTFGWDRNGDGIELKSYMLQTSAHTHTEYWDLIGEERISPSRESAKLLVGSRTK